MATRPSRDEDDRPSASAGQLYRHGRAWRRGRGIYQPDDEGTWGAMNKTQAATTESFLFDPSWSAGSLSGPSVACFIVNFFCHPPGYMTQIFGQAILDRHKHVIYYYQLVS